MAEPESENSSARGEAEFVTVQLMQGLQGDDVAISLATGYLRHHAGETAQQYLATHEKHRQRLGSCAIAGADPIISASLGLSVDDLSRSNTDAVALLDLICMFDTAEVPHALLQTGSEEEYRTHLRVLSAYGLAVPSEFEVIVPDAIKQATLAYLRSRNQLSHWTNEAISRLHAVMRPVNHPDFHQYLPHVKALISLHPDVGDDWVRVLYNSALDALTRGHSTDAEICVTEALKMSQAYQANCPEIAMKVVSLAASTYGACGRHAEAERLAVEILETTRGRLGPHHSDTLICMSNLATQYVETKRWSEAEEMQRAHLERTREAFGSEHSETLASMAQLSITFGLQGRWNEAETMQKTIVDVARRIRVENDPNMAKDLSRLARTYIGQKRWERAASTQEEAVDFSKRLEDEHDDLTREMMAELAWIYAQMGLHSRARRMAAHVWSGGPV